MSSWNANIDKTKYLTTNSLMRESTDKYQSRPHKAIYDFSNYDFTDNEKSLLHKGLDFAFPFSNLNILILRYPWTFASWQKRNDLSIISVKPLNHYIL